MLHPVGEVRRRDLSEGRLTGIACPAGPAGDADEPPAAPARQHPLGKSWGFGVWVYPRGSTTTIGTPFATTYAPLGEARFAALAVTAMNSPDAPLADLTFVGRIDGRLTVVTVELSY